MDNSQYDLCPPDVYDRKGRFRTYKGPDIFRSRDKEAKEAEYQLAKARREDKELSAREKERYAEALVKNKLTILQLKTDNIASKDSPELMEKTAQLGLAMQNTNQLQIREW